MKNANYKSLSIDAYVEFSSTTGIQQNFIDRYSVEVTTSDNGLPSTVPTGKFILTMFHVFKN